MTKCTGITQGGERCKRIAIDGSDYCYAHHPEHAHARARAARKGGRRGGRGRPQAEIAEFKSEVHEVIEAVRSGELDKGVGAVVFQGYNTLLKAVSVELDLKEQLELIGRLESLEGALEEKKGGRGRWGA